MGLTFYYIVPTILAFKIRIVLKMSYRQFIVKQSTKLYNPGEPLLLNSKVRECQWN